MGDRGERRARTPGPHAGGGVRREYDGDPRSLGRAVNPVPWLVLRAFAALYIAGALVWIVFIWDRRPQ